MEHTLAQLDYDTVLNTNFDAFLEGLRYQKLKYYASELSQAIAIESFEELKSAVNRAMNACRAQQLETDDHFKPIYRCEESQLINDWKLSPLAYCLVLINSNPSNPQVARLQLQLVSKIMNKSKSTVA